MPPDCMTSGKLSWVLAHPQPKASSLPWLVAPVIVPGVGGGPTPPHFSWLSLWSLQEKPGISRQGGEAAGSVPWQTEGMFPWGWDAAGCWDWGGRGGGGGRMELPLGGQFRSTVWDEAVGKGDFTQPPLQGDVRESALQALEG